MMSLGIGFGSEEQNEHRRQPKMKTKNSCRAHMTWYLESFRYTYIPTT